MCTKIHYANKGSKTTPCARYIQLLVQCKTETVLHDYLILCYSARHSMNVAVSYDV